MKRDIHNGRLFFVSVLTVIMSVGILAPLENYFTNLDDMPFACSDFFVKFFTISILILFASACIGCYLKGYLLKILCSAFFSLGITTYIQVMALNRRLSEEDGRALDFDSLGKYPLISTIIWAVILLSIFITLVFLKNKWKNVIFFIGGGICLVQAVAAISLPISHGVRNRAVYYDLSAMNEFNIACDENIIVFIIDSMGNIQFENAVQEFPEITDSLTDFTYYNNADCAYAWTFPSLTHMFTGCDIDFDEKSRFLWQKKAWGSEKVQKYYDMLHDAGYSVNLYSSDVYYEYGEGDNLLGKFDNVHKFKRVVVKKLVVDRMFKYSLYKTLPYVFKPKYQVLTDDFKSLRLTIYLDEDRIASPNLFSFHEDMLNGLTVDNDDKKALKIYHLNGTHYPHRISENFERIENATSNQVVCANMKLVKMYIDELKRLNAYDNAAIIITADHGMKAGPIDPQPILFVKNKGDTAENMTVSSAPVSHDDFMASILDFAGLDYSEYGKAYKDYGENELRERTVCYLSWIQDYHAYYTYIGDRYELLKKFPGNPDYTVKALKYR